MIGVKQDQQVDFISRKTAIMGADPEGGGSNQG